MKFKSPFHHNKMSLHLILGPMFSGKSSLLIKYIRSFRIIGKNMMILKPSIDDRYSETHICSHNKDMESCQIIPTDQLHSILSTPEFDKASVIIIEEGQFFTSLSQTIRCILDHQKHIIISGLNGDSNRNVFGEIHLLLPLCTKIELLQALCIQCKDGTPAHYSKRIDHSMEQVLVGSQDKYEAVCVKHY